MNKENDEEKVYDTKKFKCKLPISTVGTKALACLIKFFQARMSFVVASTIENMHEKSAYWGKIIQNDYFKGNGKYEAEDIISGCRSLGISCDDKETIQELTTEFNACIIKTMDKDGIRYKEAQCKLIKQVKIGRRHK
mmetsp:Transcript_15542/g.13584  ORF Transcript_15542/g.13584 Transcript_15542/m.13584 type:complete len:137 (+) Transcript_15542:880-1290(+)